MAYSLQQTDTAATDGAIAACSGTNAGTTTDNRRATSGGTAGTTTHSVTVGITSVRRLVHFETAPGELDGHTIPSGNWVVRLNVTVAGADMIWDSVWICRVDSNGISQGTIGSATSQGVNLTSTGVKSITVSGNSDTPNTGDRIYIVLGMRSAGGDTITYKPDQLIDTPIASGATTSDNLGMNDTPSRIANGIRRIADNTGFTEAFQRLANALRLISDNCGLNEIQVYAKVLAWNRTVSENFGNQDSMLRLVTTLRLIADNMGFKEVMIQPVPGRGMVVIDNLALNEPFQTIYRNILRVKLENLAVPTDQVFQRFIPINLIDKIGFQQTMKEIITWFRMFSDNIAGVLTIARAVPTYFRVFSNNLGVTDTGGINRLSNTFRAFPDNLGLTDLASRNVAFSKVTTDNLGLQQGSFTKLLTLTRTLQDNVGMTESIFRLANAFRNLQPENFGVRDSAQDFVIWNRVPIDNFGIHEIGIQNFWAKIIIDRLGGQEVFLRLANAFRILSENLAVIEGGIPRIANATRVWNEAFGVTDQILRQSNANRVFSNNMGLRADTAATIIAAVIEQVIELTGD